jgi:hypothetical protein
VGGFKVDHDRLREHASHLDEHAQSVGRIGSAAQARSLGSAFSDDAFGLMCSFLPPVISKCMPSVTDAITEAGTTIGTAAGGVRAMADNYQATDDAIAEGLNRIDPEAAGG